MEVIASGFGLTEAPRYDADGRLWFTDVTEGGIHRLLPDGSIETVVEKRRGVGGLALHEDGGVIMSGRDLIHVGPGGGQRTLLSLEDATGFNDIACDPDGLILAGVLRYHPLKSEEPVPGYLARVVAEGSSEEVFGGITWPNGVGVSPDGQTIYMADYAAERVMSFSGGVAAEFARAPEGASTDGLAVDEEGGVWVALGAGRAIGRFTSTGELDELIDVPADFVSSLTFGGDDRRDLYVTSFGSILRGRAGVAGLPTVLARV